MYSSTSTLKSKGIEFPVIGECLEINRLGFSLDFRQAWGGENKGYEQHELSRSTFQVRQRMAWQTSGQDYRVQTGDRISSFCVFPQNLVAVERRSNRLARH
jgi:hypothetical protein